MARRTLWIVAFLVLQLVTISVSAYSISVVNRGSWWCVSCGSGFNIPDEPRPQPFSDLDVRGVPVGWEYWEYRGTEFPDGRKEIESTKLLHKIYAIPVSMILFAVTFPASLVVTLRWWLHRKDSTRTHQSRWSRVFLCLCAFSSLWYGAVVADMETQNCLELHWNSPFRRWERISEFTWWKLGHIRSDWFGSWVTSWAFNTTNRRSVCFAVGILAGCIWLFKPWRKPTV